MKRTKTLSVIIPNFNGRKLLEAYIPSIYAALQKLPNSYEFIVVDDHSNDDSQEFLKTQYPDIKLLINSCNKGFAHTCNAGFEQAQGELILLLNSDIKLTDSYIQKCLPYFDDEQTFAVMGRAIDNTSTAQTTGLLYRITALKIKRNIKSSTPQTEFLSGANLLLNREKLKLLGGFDPIFSPFYFEDDDLSLRAKKMAWTSYFEAQAICYHLGSHTIRENTAKRKIKITYFRNKMLLQALHNPQYLGLDTSFILLFLLQVLPKFLIGKFWIMQSFYQLMQQRKAIQKSKQTFQTLRAAVQQAAR